LGDIAADEDQWMDQQAKHFLPEAVAATKEAEIIVDVNRLLNGHIALQRRVITLILYYLCGDTNEWEGRHLDGVLQLAASENPSAKISLPYGLVAYKEYHLLHIARQSDLPEPNPVPVPVMLNIPERGKAVAVREEFELTQFGFKGTMELLEGAVFPADDWEAVFDYEKLENRSFLVRGRQEGDFLQPYGMNGTKKLKDLFIEARVPRGIRDEWPIWTLQGQIVWVPGIRRSQMATVSPNTRNTLRIRVTRYKYSGD
jgi:tRNA(Ile)-lysidine synthase